MILHSYIIQYSSQQKNIGAPALAGINLFPSVILLGHKQDRNRNLCENKKISFKEKMMNSLKHIQVCVELGVCSYKRYGRVINRPRAYLQLFILPLLIIAITYSEVKKSIILSGTQFLDWHERY